MTVPVTDPGAPSVSPTVPTTTEPITPAATGDTTPQAPAADPSASEGVTTPTSPEDKNIPYERFKEVNDKAKQTADELEKANQELEELRASKTTPTEEEAPTLDPEAQKVLDAYIKSKGFVTQDELNAKELQLQAETDVRELKSEFEDFDKHSVLKYAEENGLMINDKNGLKSVYNMMKGSDVSAKDAMRNEIIAELKESGQLAGPALEKPGPGGPQVTPSEKPVGTRSILRAAIQKHRS